MSVRDRLLDFIAKKDLKVSHFEQECGLSNGYVHNISKSIQPDKIERISQKYPDLNIAWLITGKGDMYNISVDSTLAAIAKLLQQRVEQDALYAEERAKKDKQVEDLIKENLTMAEALKEQMGLIKKTYVPTNGNAICVDAE